MSIWTYKTYRCTWRVQNGTVDQYGMNFVPYWSESFPTREEAIARRSEVAHEHEYVKERWVPNDAPHSYVESQINYVEELVNEEEKENDVSRRN